MFGASKAVNKADLGGRSDAASKYNNQVDSEKTHQRCLGSLPEVCWRFIVACKAPYVILSVVMEQKRLLCG